MKNSIKNMLNENCCGCTACSAICPKDAIKMSENEKGFLYPVVNEDKCIDCGRCISVCQLTHDSNYPELQSIYAVRNLDGVTREKSSSGGVFSLLASYIENKNGVIYGAEFDKDFGVKHCRAEKEAEWIKFTRSKYLQSDLNSVFYSVKQDLENNKYVLFSGTPCQIHGLKLFLNNKNDDKLLTCDIVCHGVSSPKIWKQYLSYVEKKTKKKIADVNFRNKKDVGWHNSTIMISDTNNEVLINESQSKNFYFLLFFNHLILRHSCFNCKFANFNRPGDITIGDFWGIEKNYAFFDDDKGTSLVLLNSQKGHNFFNEIKCKTQYIEVDKDKCLQPNLKSPSRKPYNYGEFWKIYSKVGLVGAGKYFGFLKLNYFERVLAKLVSILRRLKNKLLR